MNEQIVVNAIRTPDGTILRSRSVHDYKEYKDTTSRETYMVDGGTYYLRRNVCDTPYEELTCYEDDPIEKIREVFDWGHRSADGKLNFTLLKDLTVDHIHDIVAHIDIMKGTEFKFPDYIAGIFDRELKYRNDDA